MLRKMPAIASFKTRVSLSQDKPFRKIDIAIPNNIRRACRIHG